MPKETASWFYHISKSNNPDLQECKKASYLFNSLPTTSETSNRKGREDENWKRIQIGKYFR